jgi:hypothetical protein
MVAICLNYTQKWSITDPFRGARPVFWDRKPAWGEPDRAKFARNLKVGGFFPASLEVQVLD